jgi:hypothetical protein
MLNSEQAFLSYPHCTVKIIIFKAAVAENLCQAPGTGLYLDVYTDSLSREITLLQAMWDVHVF